MNLIHPEGLYDDQRRFLIDHTIDALINPGDGRSARLHARWGLRSDPRGFSRRALDVAITASLMARGELEMGLHIEDWRAAAQDAAKAATSLRKYLKNISRGSKPAFPTGGSTVLEPSLRQFHGHQRTHPDAKARAALASLDAKTLADADELLHRLEAHASGVERSLRAGRINPGDPTKRAFVAILAEAWMFLTGSKPSSQSERKNVFLEFVAYAWADAGGDGEQNFVRAVKRYLSDFPDGVDPGSEFYRPSFL